MGNRKSLLSERCLVLNKSWLPIGTISVFRAISLAYKYSDELRPRVKIIDAEDFQQYTWKEWEKLDVTGKPTIQSSSGIFIVPEIILLTHYDKFPRNKLGFSKRSIYKRDNYTCQYCGKKLKPQQITIDHVIPRSRGGQTTWENCVVACYICNRRKGNLTPHEAKMKLINVPKMPPIYLHKYDPKEQKNSWKPFLKIFESSA